MCSVKRCKERVSKWCDFNACGKHCLRRSECAKHGAKPKKGIASDDKAQHDDDDTGDDNGMD